MSNGVFDPLKKIFGLDEDIAPKKSGVFVSKEVKIIPEEGIETTVVVGVENGNPTKPEGTIIESNFASKPKPVQQIPVQPKPVNPPKPVVRKPPEPIVISKLGYDHFCGNMNNQDFVFRISNLKVVLDGCGSGKHSEVGTQLFGQIFAYKVKEMYENKEEINEQSFVTLIDRTFKRMRRICADDKFVAENYCFTILVCVELKDEFVVFSAGDGFIITEDTSGNIKYEKLDDGEYPAYYVYNFFRNKSCLTAYQNGVSFKIHRYSKSEYKNVGVASDGLRFAENMYIVDQEKLKDFIREGRPGKILQLIQKINYPIERPYGCKDCPKNQGTYGGPIHVFHDDISICF